MSFDNRLITGSCVQLFFVTSGLRVISPFLCWLAFAAVVCGSRPVKLPFCIFGLADDSISEVFFSLLPFFQKAVKKIGLELHSKMIAFGVFFVRNIVDDCGVMLVKLE